MIGKCPKCGSRVTMFRKEVFTAHLAELEKYQVFTCRTCQTRLTWHISDRMARLGRYLPTLGILLAIPLVVFHNAVAFHLFITGLSFFAVFLALQFKPVPQKE